MSFASDNHSAIHPLILKSIADINHGSCASYQLDAHSKELGLWVKKNLGTESYYLTFNGTAANVVALAALLKPYQSVLCSKASHLYNDECGAPEKLIGSKLIPLEHVDGKISVDAIKKELVRKGDQHYSQVKVVSITQPTEYGTVYSLKELREISTFCKQENLYLHLDGARIANAAWSLKTTLAEILSYVDIATVGGSKSGLMAGDLVLVMNPEINTSQKGGLKFIRKQLLQLPSKSRFFAIQFLTYFKEQLYKEIAHHQCSMAQLLEQQFLEAKISLTRPVQSNAVFSKIPRELVKPLKKEFFFYVWDEHSFESRFMTSFDTTKEQIYNFGNYLKKLKDNS